MEKSFYDLDYIIELNYSRLEQYTSAYQKVLERLTNLILVYSAITIFLVQLIQDVFLLEIKNWLFYLCFATFLVLLIISIVNTVRLIIPVDVAFLEVPKRYYEEYRIEYEKTETDLKEVDKLLKASYIDELEKALESNGNLFRRKSSFYYKALTFALLSVIPYIVCLGFHISRKEDKIQKVQLVSSEISIKLQQTKNMDKENGTQKGKDIATHGKFSVNTKTTKLPGVDSSKVISSKPLMVRENSSKSR